MAKVYSTEDIFESGEFRKLAEVTYRPSAIGYVTMYNEHGDTDILVARRLKESDPLRKGQLILPGGGLGRDLWLEAAMHEVLEETGVETEPVEGYELKFANLKGTEGGCIVKPRDEAVAIIEPCGNVWFYYRDSGKAYFLNVVHLDPVSEPRENPESDARNPKFILLEDARWTLFREFTPACKVLVEMADSAEGGPSLLGPNDFSMEVSGLRSKYLNLTPYSSQKD